jgi:hypothetical protein
MMRPVILALCFCAGTTAFCQSTVPAPMTPESPWQTPLMITPSPARDFSKLPPGWHITDVKPLPAPRMLFQPPHPLTTRRLGDAEIDPKIIVHPSATSIGVLPPGTQVAQNAYPHLQLRPIESSNSALQQTPTNWPSFQIETIPTPVAKR